MSRKSLLQKNKVKTTLRQTMVATAAAVSGLVVILLVIFNLFEEEEGRAAENNMIYKSATVIQDTTNVLRGARNQMVIGVRLDFAGNRNPAKVGALVFSAVGTAVPISRNVSNARLWYTAESSDFQAINQVGSTVKLVDSKDFTIQVNREVKPGANYFWLTFDIDAQATTSPGAIDAACREIRIGAISYRPDIPSPAGKRFVEANIPYYSMGNFAINKLNSWNSKRDGSGIAPRQLNETRNSYFIQSGHVMISSNGGNLQTLVVENGGELKITSPLRLNTVYVACGGKMEQEAEVSDYYCFNNFILEGGAQYIHNNTGLFPGLNCRFSPASTVQFIRIGEKTLMRESLINWGCVTITPEEMKEVSLDPFTNVFGSLQIKSATRKLICTSSLPGTSRISGDLVLDGVSFLGSQGRNKNNLSLHIGGNLLLTNSTFTTGVFGNYDLFIKGNVSLQDASIWLGSNNTTCHFSGMGTTRWSQNTGSDAILGNTIIEPLHELRVESEAFAELAPRCTFVVEAGADFYCGKSILTGDGTFILEDLATLGIGNTEGLHSEAFRGNIQTAGRIYNSGATYVFNGAGTYQQTGIFETAPAKNTVRSLIIEKERKSQVLTLSQDISIEDQFHIARGDIRTGNFELRVPQMQVRR
jgi:hypothetical protein